MRYIMLVETSQLATVMLEDKKILENKNCFICRFELLPDQLITVHSDEDGYQHPFHAICGEPWLQQHHSCGLCKKKISNVSFYFNQLRYGGKTFPQKLGIASNRAVKKMIETIFAIYEGVRKVFDFMNDRVNALFSGLRSELSFIITGIFLTIIVFDHVNFLNKGEKNDKFVSFTNLNKAEKFFYDTGVIIIANSILTKILKPIFNTLNKHQRAYFYQQNSEEMLPVILKSVGILTGAICFNLFWIDVHDLLTRGFHRALRLKGSSHLVANIREIGDLVFKKMCYKITFVALPTLIPSLMLGFSQFLLEIKGVIQIQFNNKN